MPGDCRSPACIYIQAQHHVPLKNAGANGFYSPDASAIQLPSPQMLTEYRKLIGGAKIGSVTLDEKTATVFTQFRHFRDRALTRHLVHPRGLCKGTAGWQHEGCWEGRRCHV